MIEHSLLCDHALKALIKSGVISFGGNEKLRIYGRLDCSSGKRMKKENRVFFVSQEEAEDRGYRPCGHCLKMDYKIWKNGLSRNKAA